MNRRGFLLATGVGTLAALTACGLTESVPGGATPAPPATQDGPTTGGAPGVRDTPVPQRGAPAVTRTTPPDTLVSWVPDTHR